MLIREFYRIVECVHMKTKKYKAALRMILG
jgi:hypothetical protein